MTEQHGVLANLRERFADLIDGGGRRRQLEEITASVRHMWGAYLDGPYQLQPDELLRQLGEYDSAYLWDLVNQLQYEQIGSLTSYREGDAGREWQLAVQESRRLWRYSVLYQWAVSLWTSYGFGEGLEIVPDDEKAQPPEEVGERLGEQAQRTYQDRVKELGVWQEFWSADRNARLLGEASIYCLSEDVLRDGNVILAYYASTSDGETTVAELDVDEVKSVVTHPENKWQPLFYKREFSLGAKAQTWYYPDWQAYFSGKLDETYKDGKTLAEYVGVKDDQRTDKMRANGLLGQPGTVAVAQHIAYNAKDRASLWGWPLSTTGAAWDRAHKQYMQNRLSVSAAKAMYVRRLRMAGGSRNVKSVANQIASHLSATNYQETNPAAAAGSTFLHNRATDYEDLPMRTGADDAKTDEEMFAWMPILAYGLFPHYAGKGDAYRLATACYSDDTEVLTEKGWRGWRDVGHNMIATYNQGLQQIEYMWPQKLHVYDYDGPMIQFEGRSVDALVTPNHRMLALNENNVSRKWAKTAFEVIQADSLPSRFALPARALCEARPVIEAFILPSVGQGQEKSRLGTRAFPMDDWLEFLGWWLSEGWLNGTGYNHVVGICQNVDSPDVERIEALLDRLPFQFNRGIKDEGRTIRWRTNDKALYDWLEKNCGKGAKSKRLPGFAYDMNREQTRILVDALWAGDGHSEEHEHYKGFFTSTSKELIDGLQALLLNLGEWGTIAVNRPENGHPDFETSAACWILHRSDRWKFSLARRNNVKAVQYSGKVWCFEALPNTMFITRRNGYPLIAGNTSMERPLEFQFSRYRKFWSSHFRVMLKVVLKFAEQFGKMRFETYNGQVSTDKLVQADLESLSGAIGTFYRDFLVNMNAMGEIPQEVMDAVNIHMLQTVLQAVGADEVMDIISPEAFKLARAEKEEEPDDLEQPDTTSPPEDEEFPTELDESHVPQVIDRTCPFCGGPSAEFYEGHGNWVRCVQCGKTYDRILE